MKLAPRLERLGQARNSSLVTRQSVDVHIDELVLHGFAPGDRHRIAGAVEIELARLMSEGGQLAFPKNPPDLGRINAGAFRVEAGAKPQAVGTEIARAVFRSLRQHARASARAGRTRQSLGVRHPQAS
jgi:hypothetical protein